MISVLRGCRELRLLVKENNLMTAMVGSGVAVEGRDSILLLCSLGLFR
jgi:hypothetical protein